jgi:hypothetical protein
MHTNIHLGHNIFSSANLKYCGCGVLRLRDQVMGMRCADTAH